MHCTDLCTCGTKNKSCKNKPVFIFIFDYIYHLPCAFRAISRSSEVYMFYNLHLSVIVRIIKVQPCYQRRLTDQRKRKREFWKIEVIDRSIVVYMVFLSRNQFAETLKSHLFSYEVAFIQTAHHFIWLPDAESLLSTEYYMVHLLCHN